MMCNLELRQPVDICVTAAHTRSISFPVCLPAARLFLLSALRVMNHLTSVGGSAIYFLDVRDGMAEDI